MLTHEEVLRRQFADLTALFKQSFRHVQPPETHWWSIWLQKYRATDIADAITELSTHPLKARFTQESCGRAISALLKQKSVSRVITGGLS